jgi:hypothetical protein
MQRAIQTALLAAIRNLSLYYYSSSPSRDVASSLRLGIVAEFDSDADISDVGHVEVQIGGSKALKPLLHEREQGAQTSEGCVRIASHQGHHYVWA